MSAQPALEFHGIRKEFAGQVAVNDVSFSVLPVRCMPSSGRTEPANRL